MVAEDLTDELRRDRAHDGVRVGQRFGQVAGGQERLGKIDIAEEEGVAMLRADAVDDLGFMGPQNRGKTLLGQELGEGRTP
jgi:hypothetical protein